MVHNLKNFLWRMYIIAAYCTTLYKIDMKRTSSITLASIDIENRFPVHRCDSIQGTDYIVNPLFLNLKVSRITIENLR